MAYFAKVLNGKVVDIMICDQDYMDNYIDTSPGTWIETFKDGSARGHYAGVGSTYDSENDRFLKEQPYPSWTLDEETLSWNPPSIKPEGTHKWNEETQTWDALESE